jgi:DeoR family glycerol-3-phosphate regulon repressor
MTEIDMLDSKIGARPIQVARLTALMKLLEERGHCSVAELAEHFDVSEETIRRDIRQLERTGRVQKTHGGVSIPSSELEAPYRIRLREQAEAKQRIARHAARTVTEGMTLLLDSGTTCLWLARALAGLRDLTIITNSLEVAHDVAGRPGQRLFLAGGPIKPDYHAAFGPEAIGFCQRFVPDITVMSMGAIDATRGFLDFDSDEATFKRSILDRSRRVVVLADSTKFAKPGFIQVAEFAAVQSLYTDAEPPAAVREAATAAGMAIEVAG